MAKNSIYSRTGYSVQIREKQLSDGRISLYLDIYSEGKRRYEFLKLYKRQGTDKATRDFNRSIVNAAEKIKSDMLVNFANGEAGISPQRQYKNKSVMETMEEFIGEKEKNGIETRGYRTLRTHISNYKGEAVFKDIDKEWVKGFIDFLKTVRKANGKLLGATSSKCYQTCLSTFLRWCVKKGYISDSPMDRLDRDEKIRVDLKGQREYLEGHEIKALIVTDCYREEVKQAFLFAVFTGLRISDIIALRWSDINIKEGVMAADIVMKKTRRPIEITISELAMEWLPEKGDDDRVFKLPTLMTINTVLGKWTKEAGIDKKITFHCARHTFATSCLSADIDIYTVSKLLGHTEVKTTQIYAEIVDRKKREAAIRLSDYMKRVLGGKPDEGSDEA